MVNIKKIITWSSYCLVLTAQADQPPSWYKNYDNIIGKMDGLAIELIEQAEFIQEWITNLKPWCKELRARGRERDELFTCIKKAFKNIDKEGKKLETTIASRNNDIIDLKKKIEKYEDTIAGLNKAIAEMEKQLLELKSAYVTLFELDEERIDGLINEIDELQTAYKFMISERDKLRKTLEMFYQCIKAHDHDEHTDMQEFAKELGCNFKE